MKNKAMNCEIHFIFFFACRLKNMLYASLANLCSFIKVMLRLNKCIEVIKVTRPAMRTIILAFYLNLDYVH